VLIFSNDFFFFAYIKSGISLNFHQAEIAMPVKSKKTAEQPFRLAPTVLNHLFN
jgi:hypothetical protein